MMTDFNILSYITCLKPKSFKATTLLAPLHKWRVEDALTPPLAAYS